MIKELKIGNQIFEEVNGEKKIITVDIHTMELVDTYPDKYSGLRLTSQILDILGTKHEECYDISGLKIHWSDNDGSKTFYHINDQTMTYFDTMHHLQNYLFFITLLDGTATELKLKQ